MNTVQDILDRARSSGTRIATAESCTGGLVAAALTDIAGSSQVFDRGFVTYSNAAKIEMLGVAAETLAQFGAVSQEVAAEMAACALQRSGADLTVAITGIAGPGGSEHKPEGRVCFAIASATVVEAATVEFGAIGRKNVRAAACTHALNLLKSALSQGG